MGKSKNILAVVIVAIIGTLIFWKRDWVKEKFGVITKLKSANNPEQNASTPPPSIPGVTFTNCNKFPLKVGCSGAKVKGLQLALNRNFNAGLSVDGHFGLQTEQALENAGFGKEVELAEVIKIMK